MERPGEGFRLMLMGAMPLTFCRTHIRPAKFDFPKKA